MCYNNEEVWFISALTSSEAFPTVSTGSSWRSASWRSPASWEPASGETLGESKDERIEKNGENNKQAADKDNSNISSVLITDRCGHNNGPLTYQEERSEFLGIPGDRVDYGNNIKVHFPLLRPDLHGADVEIKKNQQSSKETQL